MEAKWYLFLGVIALILASFVAGFFISRAQTPAEVRIVLPDHMSLEVTGSIATNISGTIDEKTPCLKWATENFEKPTTGSVSVVCNGHE